MGKSKSQLVKFIDKKGVWKQEVCHDVNTCREHAALVIRTRNILKKNPNMNVDLDDSYVEIFSNPMDVFATSSENDNEKLNQLNGLLAPNQNEVHSINNQLKLWKQLMPNIRPKGTNLEQLIDNAIRAKGVETGWDPESHKVSEDMKIVLNDEDTSISIKTGIWSDAKNTLVISGSRTGEHKTIEAKVNHLKTSSAELYLLIAGAKDAKAEDPYYMITFNHDVIDFGSPENWTEDKSKWFYETDDVRLEIRKSMSDQLWVVIKNSKNINVQLLDI